MLASILSALHLLSLGVGLGAVYSRGRALRALAAGETGALGRVLWADNWWGIASLFWIATGLTRLFGGTDKALDFYLYNGFFWLKMTLFLLIFLLEIAPMVSFIRWRMVMGKGGSPDTTRVPLFARLNDLETALVIAIPFTAAA